MTVDVVVGVIAVGSAVNENVFPLPLEDEILFLRLSDIVPVAVNAGGVGKRALWEAARPTAGCNLSGGDASGGFDE